MTRHRTGRLSALLLAAFALAACSDEGLLSLGDSGENGDPPALSVLTWNIYVGARLENLLVIQDPNLIPFEVAALMDQVAATDFPARAEKLADLIAAAGPDVISLQEVSLFRTQSPGDFLLGNPVSATTPFLDWLAILTDALATRGLSYEVAAQTENFDVELPMVNSATGGIDDVRLTDFDVILTRSDVTVSSPASGNFAAALPLEMGGLTILKPSGWASVDIDVRGQRYRYLNTHLEAADLTPGVVDPQLAGLQAAQLTELQSVMDGSPYPVILTGDLNSAADGTSTTTYRDLLNDGFVDTWLAGSPLGPGYTANQAPDLLSTDSQLFHRIDFILFRNEAGAPGQLSGSTGSGVLGERPADRTSDGLWPSDHAGVITELEFAPAGGAR